MTEDFDHHIARLQTAARDRVPTEPRPPRRRWPFGVAAGLVVAGVIGAAVGLTSGGTASTAEPVATTIGPKSVACDPGQHTSTPEAYYDCVNGAWVRGTAPATTPPATVPPTTAPPTTTPPTTEAPTTVPPTTQPVPTTTPPPDPAPTINITCPTPKNSAADSLRADFGYDFHATTPALVRWGIEYGDGRSYTADNEAKARTQVFWHYYRSPGTYTVTAWVEDAIGRRANGSCQFTWIAPPAPPTPRRPPSIPEILPDPPYRFRQTADGEPIRWRACLSMHWRYNPNGEPSPATINVVRAAVAEISAASGIEMIEDGVTSIDVSDPNQVLPSLADGEVVIGFAPPGSPAIPLVSSYHDLPANVERNGFVGGTGSPRRNGADITRGSVAFNREEAVEPPLDFSSNGSFGAALLHEIGHVVGLQHVDPSTQIMGTWGAPWNSRGHLGTGDLAGLATLKDRPCPQPPAAPVPTEPTTTEPPITTTEPPTTEPPTITEPPTTETTVPSA